MKRKTKLEPGYKFEQSVTILHFPEYQKYQYETLEVKSFLYLAADKRSSQTESYLEKSSHPKFKNIFTIQEPK